MKIIRPKVLFILSANYSGSHLLTHLISSNTKACSVGELKNVDKLLNRPSHSHSVIHDYASNPLFNNIHTFNQEEWHVHLFEKIRKEQGNVVCLVDNSKKIEWARNFVNHPDLDAIFLHLIRDPRALIRRWGMKYTDEKQIKRQRLKLAVKSPFYGLKTILKNPYDVYAYKWLIENTKISKFLVKNKQRDNIISYLDLVSDTRVALKKIMEIAGVPYEDSQLNFGDSKHIGTIKKDYLAQTKSSKIELDLRWKNELHPSIANNIIKNKGINQYLKLIKHEWAENGISAVKKSGPDESNIFTR